MRQLTSELGRTTATLARTISHVEEKEEKGEGDMQVLVEQGREVVQSGIVRQYNVEWPKTGVRESFSRPTAPLPQPSSTQLQEHLSEKEHWTFLRR
jgi:hypothetical protein